MKHLISFLLSISSIASVHAAIGGPVSPSAPTETQTITAPSSNDEGINPDADKTNNGTESGTDTNQSDENSDRK